jgi:hypothetical protein
MNAGQFLRYQCHVPSQEEIAEWLQIRLHPQNIIHGDMITQSQYVADTTPATNKPSESSISNALTHLERIAKNPTGHSWKDDVQASGEDTNYPCPVRAILATDLVNLISREGVLPAVASWAVFSAIESGALLAICQQAIFEPIPEMTDSQRRRQVAERIQRWHEWKQQGEIPASPESIVASAPSVPQYSQGLFVWSKSIKPPGKRGARSRFSMSLQDEQRIAEAWGDGERGYKTYASLAIERGNGETSQDIKRVLDRQKRERCASA